MIVVVVVFLVLDMGMIFVVVGFSFEYFKDNFENDYEM